MAAPHSTIKCKAKIEKFTLCPVTHQPFSSNMVVSNNAEVTLLRNEFREIILTVSAKSGSLAKSPQSFVLKDVNFHHKFVKEGKLTIEVRNIKRRIFLSNAPPHSLKEFVKLLMVKMEACKVNVSDRTRMVAKLKTKSAVDEISPLKPEDIKKANEKVLKEQQKVKRKCPTALPFSDVTNTLASKRKFTMSKTTFNQCQLQVLQAIRSGENVFFTGGAGTGKTFLLKHAIGTLPPKGTCVTATTGAAACLIGGITLHSFAGAGKAKGTPQECLAVAKKRPATIKRWLTCERLIIDEVSMVSGPFFDILDYIARMIRGKNKPFGGIQLILSGDFFQLPPVSKTPADKKMCFQSRAWNECGLRMIELDQIYRQNDATFISILRQIRVGRCDERAAKLLAATEHNQLGHDGIKATRLCTHRENVTVTNQQFLAALEGTEKTYHPHDNNQAFSSYISQLLPDTEQVTVKIGAQVMLTKNIDPSRGLVNGTRGVVTDFSSDDGLPVIKFLSGEKRTVGYERWSVSINPELRVIRRQVPLKLAWAISIHKSQGMTIDCCELDLGSTFEDGQAYVALSRVRTLASLRVKSFTPKCIRVNNDVINFYLRQKRQSLEV